MSTYLDGKAVQQPEPSFLNENGPIKPDRSTADSVHVKFDIEDVNAERLINDHDEIEETLALEREISAFELRM